MPRQVKPEVREKDLNDYQIIMHSANSLLIDIARRSTQHAEQVIIAESEADQLIGSAYIEATAHLKLAVKAMSPIGASLQKLQPPPPPSRLVRFFFFLIGKDWKQRALTA